MSADQTFESYVTDIMARIIWNTERYLERYTELAREAVQAAPYHPDFENGLAKLEAVQRRILAEKLKDRLDWMVDDIKVRSVPIFPDTIYKHPDLGQTWDGNPARERNDIIVSLAVAASEMVDHNDLAERLLQRLEEMNQD